MLSNYIGYIVLAAVVASSLSIAFLTSSIANSKGRRYWPWFVLSLMFTALPAIVVSILPRAKKPAPIAPNGFKRALQSIAWTPTLLGPAFIASGYVGTQLLVVMAITTGLFWFNNRQEEVKIVVSKVLTFEIKAVLFLVPVVMAAMMIPILGAVFAGLIYAYWYISSAIQIVNGISPTSGQEAAESMV